MPLHPSYSTPEIVSAARQRLSLCARPVRLLLVEDDESDMMLARHVLFKFPVEVMGARDSDEAKLMVNNLPMDCVLVDLRLPKPDGAEFCRFVLDEHPSLVVAVITGLRSADECPLAGRVSEYASQINVAVPIFIKPLDGDDAKALLGENHE